MCTIREILNVLICSAGASKTDYEEVCVCVGIFTFVRTVILSFEDLIGLLQTIVN